MILIVSMQLQYRFVDFFIPYNKPLLITWSEFSIEVLRHNPPLPGLPDHALPVLNHDRTDHNKKTNVAMVHSNSSVIQLLLYDVIT